VKGLNQSARRAITLARHGKPALSRKVRLSSAGYRAWWATYEEGGIRADVPPPQSLIDLAARAGKLFSSTRRRARESAAAVVCGRAVEALDLFIEAPLPPPPVPDVFKVRPPAWGLIARTAWWLGYGEGDETRPQAEARAELAADRLLAESEAAGEVVLFAQGYFNHMIGKVLEQRGWRLVHNEGFKYWSARRFEPR
jgi:broad specificity phosphatase PhoE